MTKAVQDLMVEVERVADAFFAAVYTARSLDAALALTTDSCTLVNLPPGTGTGASGVSGQGDGGLGDGGLGDGGGLRRYLAADLLPHLPADLSFRRVSRTGNRWQVAQEDEVSFTHDRELPWLLPGVAPTGRRAEILAISVITIRRSLITSHRTLWDYYGLLAQLQLDPADAARPAPAPATR